MTKNTKKEITTETTKSKKNKTAPKKLEIPKESQKVEIAKKFPKVNFSKKRVLRVGIILLVFTGLGYLTKTQFIVATVNGSPITRLALINELEKRGGQQTADSLVTQKLVEQEAEKQSVQISQQEIDDRIAQITNSLQTQGLALEQALAQEGITLDDLRSQLAFQITLEKLVADKTTVTDEEVQKYIEDNKELYADITPEQAVQVKEALQQNKASQAINDFVTELKTSANIKYYKTY